MANPQRVIELQKYYQTTTKPLWRAHPNANLLLIPYFAAFGLSLSVALFYTGRATLGIKDVK
jgi:cytochrome c oxidase subunit 7